jgi:hypothetical protein
VIKKKHLSVMSIIIYCIFEIIDAMVAAQPEVLFFYFCFL